MTAGNSEAPTIMVVLWAFSLRFSFLMYEVQLRIKACVLQHFILNL